VTAAGGEGHLSPPILTIYNQHTASCGVHRPSSTRPLMSTSDSSPTGTASSGSSRLTGRPAWRPYGAGTWAGRVSMSSVTGGPTG
jgi:hypothetical protein